MRWYLGKIRSCTFALINNFEILQASIAFISDTVQTSLKFYESASHFSPILCDRENWNFFYIIINPYGYSMQTKFHIPRSHSFREICDDNLEKFKVARSPKWTTLKFFKLASHFSPILCDRGTWNLFCILTHMNTLCKPNFMFLGHTVFEKNAMITWKNSKLHNCPNKQIWNFTRYHCNFLWYCATEELEIFFVY